MQLVAFLVNASLPLMLPVSCSCQMVGQPVAHQHRTFTVLPFTEYGLAAPVQHFDLNGFHGWPYDTALVLQTTETVFAVISHTIKAYMCITVFR